MQKVVLILGIALLLIICFTSAYASSAAAVIMNNNVEEESAANSAGSVHTGQPPVVTSSLPYEDKWFLIDIFRWYNDGLYIAIVVYNPISTSIRTYYTSRSSSELSKQFYSGKFTIGKSFFVEVPQFMLPSKMQYAGDI